MKALSLTARQHIYMYNSDSPPFIDNVLALCHLPIFERLINLLSGAAKNEYNGAHTHTQNKEHGFCTWSVYLTLLSARILTGICTK